MTTHSRPLAKLPMDETAQEESRKLAEVATASVSAARLTSCPSSSSPSLATLESSVASSSSGEQALWMDDGMAPAPPAKGPVGLHAFFNGLAAGDEMSGLVQTLRRTLLFHFSNRRGNSSLERQTREGVPEPSSGIATSLRNATKAAMLFSTEHPAAADEATYLFFSPSTHANLARERERSETGGGGGRGHRGKPFPIRDARLRLLLSDRAAVALARHHLREDPSNPAKALEVLSTVEPTPAVSALLIDCFSRTGQWEQALTSLEMIPAQQWTELEVSRTIRTAYHAALSAVRKPPPLSSPLRHRDPELSQVMSVPLRVLQTAHAHGVMWSSPAAINDALGLLSLDAQRWPDAVKLLDSMLLAPPSRTAADCLASREEEVQVRSDTPASRYSGVPATVTHRVPAHAVVGAGDGEVLTFYPVNDQCSLTLSRDSGRLDVADERDSHNGSGASSSSGFPPHSGLTTFFLRANAITVYQTCRALRARPDLAFRYANELMDRYSIVVSADAKATEAYLRTCVRQGQWRAALAVLRAPVTASAHPGSASEDSQVYSADLVVSLLKLLAKCDATAHYGDVFASVLSRPSGQEVSGCAPAKETEQLAQQQQQQYRVPGLELSKHYNTNTLSRAYNTMIQQARSLQDAEVFYKELRAATSSAVAAPCSPSPPSPSASSSFGGAAPTAQKGETGECPTAGCKVNVAEDDSNLENESYEKFTVLYAQAGDWQRALGCLNMLLHHPARALAFVPTTTLHDAVQYALEQSASTAASPMETHDRTSSDASSVLPVFVPADAALGARPLVGPVQAADGGGAPWQLSVELFHEMCDRGVPTSAVAFQSVVKRCFSQGASEEAQKLFQLLMRRGVRRR